MSDRVASIALSVLVLACTILTVVVFTWFAQHGLTMPQLGLASPMYEVFKDFAGSVATIIAAITVGGVAFLFGRAQRDIAKAQADTAAQMLRISQQHVVLDLFDRRWAIVADLKSAIREISRSGRVDPDSERTFLAATDRAAFLFGSDVTDYLDAVAFAMVRHSSAANDLNSANLELVHRAAAERRDRAFEMISNFHREFGSLAAPYMAMAMQLPADECAAMSHRFDPTDQQRWHDGRNPA
jgi:type IV secretory pathway VirB2 component (pilin)